MPSQYASQTVTDMEECFKLAKVRSMAHCGHMKFISLSRTKSDSARSKVTRQNQGHFRRIVNESQYIEVTKPRNKSSPHNQKKKKITQRKSTKETIGQRNLWQEKKPTKHLSTRMCKTVWSSADGKNLAHLSAQLGPLWTLQTFQFSVCTKIMQKPMVHLLS